MEPWATKVVSLCILFGTTLIFGVIPIYLIRALHVTHRGHYTSARVQFFLSVLNCFAGGVFLGTTLLHLIPEVREAVQAMLERYGQTTRFAVSEFCIGCGFFLIMIIENLVMALQHHQGWAPFETMESSVSCEPISRMHSEDDSIPKPANKKPLIGQRSNNTSGVRESYGAIIPSGQDGGGSTKTLHSALSEDNTHDHQHNHHHNHHRHQVINVSKALHSSTEEQGAPLSCGRHHPPVCIEKGDSVHIIHPSHHQHHHTEPGQLASLRSFLLLLALSLHTVFEGLAIGLQLTNQAIWNLFIAIIIHKSIIAFSMGVQFAETLKTFRQAILFVVMFSIMSPIGVAIGTGVLAAQGIGDAIDTASALLQTIASGTFLYVTFFEVLNKEIGQDHSMLKVLFIILGFSCIVLLNLFNPEPDD